MRTYEEILREVDEELYQKACKIDSWWRFDVFISLLKEFFAEHQEKREHYRELLKQMCKKYSLCYEDYFFPFFSDKEDCLNLLADDEIGIDIVGQQMFKFNKEPEVLEKLFAKEPWLMVKFIQKFPDKKEEYKRKILDYFYAVERGEIVSNPFREREFFDIFIRDTDAFKDMLDELPLSEKICRTILERDNSVEIIEKMLNIVSQQPKSDETASIYMIMAKYCDDEKLCLEILQQADSRGMVFVLCQRGDCFSKDFQKILLNHPKLSLYGLNSLIEKCSDIKPSDKVIDTVLKDPASDYCGQTETTINTAMKNILRVSENPKTAEKILDYCMTIPHYGENRFSCCEIDVIKDILGKNASDSLVNRLFEYADKKMDYPYRVFETILEKKVSKEILDKVYQSTYQKCKEEIEQKAEGGKYSSWNQDFRNKKISELYNRMWNFWEVALRSTKDVALMDYIIQSRKMLRRKLNFLPKDEIAEIDEAFNEALQKVGYVPLKLKQMFPRVSEDKRIERAFNRMLLTNDEKERKTLERIFNIPDLNFWGEYLNKYATNTSSGLINFILQKKEKAIEKIPEKEDDDERRSAYEKATCIERTLYEKGYIEAVLHKKYPKLSLPEAIIREAARVVKNGDTVEKEHFNNFLLSEGEDILLNVIDDGVCDYLVENFSQKNLDDVNALRSFYGLKIVIDETDFADANVRAVRRMQFDDSVSCPDETSEYYPIQYSEAYRNFSCDESSQFMPSDYYEMLDNSKAVQYLKDFGYGYFVSQLPDVLAAAKVPPEIAVQFNAKDLQAIVYEQLPDDEKEVYGRDGDLLFIKKWVKMEDENDEHDLPGARERYWMDMVNNKQLVRLIKDDLLRHGVDGDDVEQLFSCAEEEGYPNYGRKWERVKSVFLQLHHVVGLKDGGKNYPQNYAPVVFYPSDTWWGAHFSFSSHTPLHRYDTPKDRFYVVEGAKKPTDIMLTMDKPSAGAKAVRIRTIFTDDENNRYKKVLYYGGARKNSRYVGRLHSMINVEEWAKEVGKEQKQQDDRMRYLVRIVMQNITNMQKRLKEKQTSHKSKGVRKNIERHKAEISKKQPEKRIVKKKIGQNRE